MKILLCSDLHSGHHVGLTPPDWHYKRKRGESEWNKYAAIQREMWSWWAGMIKEEGPFDYCFVVGDCIDGDGARSKGTELITADRIEQTRMATAALNEVGAGEYHFVYGTAYHTGTGEDYETLVAKHFDARIGSHEWVEVEGEVFDLKHHIGNSSVPYGQFTILGKEALHNHLWATKREQPQATIIVRGHIHKYAACERVFGGDIVTALSLPALQGYGSKFGARRCSQTIDVGCVTVEIGDGVIINPIIPKFKSFLAT